MKTNYFIGLFLLLALVGQIRLLGQNSTTQQPIISADQLATAFGYSGTLKIQDFASLGLTKPNVLQELNFTSNDSTFLPTNIKVMTAGTDLTPQQRAAFEKAASSSSPPSYFRAITLSDGTIAYLLSMGGPGGSGYGAKMTTKDGRFDLEVSFGADVGTTYEQNASNQHYYERMLGGKSDPLSELAAALPQIYSAVASNYAKVAAQKTGENVSPPPQTQTTNSSSSQPSTSSSAPVSTAPLAQNTTSPSTGSGFPLWLYGIIVLSLGLILCLWYFLRAKI